MAWKNISDDRLEEMFRHAIRVRRSIRGEDRGLYLFDQTKPIYCDGKWRDSGCSLPRVDFDESIKTISWTPSHQEQFNEVLVANNFDFGRLERAISDLGWHWDKVASGWSLLGSEEVPWLEPFCSGISEVLHKLVRAKPFRDLTWVRDYFSREVTLVIETDTDGTMSSRIDRGSSDPQRIDAHIRAQVLAARGMAGVVGARFSIEPQTEVACALCEEKFWPQELDEFDIARFGSPRYCKTCLTSISNRVDPWGVPTLTAAQSRTAALDSVHLFFQLTRVYPTSAAKKPSVAHASDEVRDRWVKACLMLPGSETVKRHFGDWTSMLAKADVLEDMPRRGHSGYRSVANDGHIALSTAERLICDYLHSTGISHDKEPLYPVDDNLNPKGLLRADWRIGEQLVEFAGRMNDKRYAENIVRKKQLAHKYGIDLLILLPTDVRKLDYVRDQFWSAVQTD